MSSSKVLPFAQQQTYLLDTPRPINYDPNNDYLRLNVLDDAYEQAGYKPGAIFIAQGDVILDGHLHYVEIGDDGFLAHLSTKTASLYLRPLDGATLPGLHERADLDFIGAVVEAYPQGLTGARWVLFPAIGLLPFEPLPF